MQDMISLRLMTIMLLCGVASCGDNQDPGGARALWERIHELDYRSWARAPGYEARVPSDAPHSDAVDIFVNDVVSDALRADTTLTSWPVGSLIVKDGWDEADLELVAVMWKREEGWYWAEYDADGSAAYSGAPALCIDCHRAGDDFVRAFAFGSAERQALSK